MPENAGPRHSAGCSDNTKAIFERGKGLCPNWEANLQTLAKTEILPNFGPGKALRGVFFGDELARRFLAITAFCG